MRKKLIRALGAIVLSSLAAPIWAQAPTVQPLPDPTPLGNPTEGPPPGASAMPLASVAPSTLSAYDSCNACSKRGYWSAGGGAYYLQPVFESNPAYFVRSGTAAGLTSFNRQDFGHDMQVAPLAWLGYTCSSGVGIRGRWWMIDADGQANSGPLDGATGIADAGGFFGVTPGAGSTVAATSNLSLHVYDLEGTYQWSCSCWSMLASMGGRYVQLRQGYQLNILDGTGAVTDTSAGHSSFNGGGPTFSFEAHRPICSSCFSVYGLVRGSLLFGTGVQNGSSTGTTGAFSSTSRQVDVLPIGEMEAGAEWGKSWGRCRLFAQVGFAGQVWLGGGNAAQGPAGSDFGNNFGFFGGVGRIGINF